MSEKIKSAFEILAEAWNNPSPSLDYEELREGEFITTALCPCCKNEWEIYFSSMESMTEREEKQLEEKGYIVSECEDCYHDSFARAYFGIEEDNGKYTPLEVYGMKGLL